MTLELTVYGEARPAGALAIGTRKDGGHFLRHRDGGALSSWKRAIASAVGEERPNLPPWPGAIRLDATFYIARPRGHYGTGRKAGTLRPSAPVYPVKRSGGDVDKLARGLLDALTGSLIHDDSQVVDLVCRKRFADSGPVRLELLARQMDELDASFELELRQEGAA